MWAEEFQRCKPGTLYSTKAAAARLGFKSEKTLRKYRAIGEILSTPTSQYKGEQINALWDKHYNGLI